MNRSTVIARTVVAAALLVLAGCGDDDGKTSPLFTNINAGLPGVYGCSLAWGDYDNDGDLDLVLAGYDGGNLISRVYRNNGGVFNTAPGAPTGLAASVSGNDVMFSWSNATDAETSASAGLSYNLRVGTTSGGDEVFSGMASASGLRRIPALGPALPGASISEWTLTLPADTYYWSVQAIDTGLMGGAWATEDSVVVP